MDIVNDVATWTGLILGVASTVLAIVTIVFSISSTRRSEEVATQTITSLQKIETTVERLSMDTNGLIKAAWDKMLDSDASANVSIDTTKEQLVAGVESYLDSILSEINSIKKSQGGESNEGSAEELRKNIENLESKLESKIASWEPRKQNAADSLIRRFNNISPPALELLKLLHLGGVHLTEENYSILLDGPLAGAVRELEENELLVNLRSRDGERVHWLSPSILGRQLDVALRLSSTQIPGLRKRVSRYLRSSGYLPLTENDSNG